MRYSEAGSTPLVVLIASGSGVAEELFFRGALWSGSRPLRATTLAYAVSTAVTGNPALVLAGLVTSVIFGWQRGATGRVLVPTVTHVTWSVLMLRYLPPLFRAGRRRSRITQSDPAKIGDLRGNPRSPTGRGLAGERLVRAGAGPDPAGHQALVPLGQKRAGVFRALISCVWA